MVTNWNADKNTCEEFGCGATLGKGSRHHCRSCGKEICGTHSFWATSNFTQKYQSSSSWSRLWTSSSANTRVCETCCLKYNLTPLKTSKSFNDANSFNAWVRNTFQIETSRKIAPGMKADQPYNMAALYNGIVFRADSYKTFKDLFNEGMTQRSDQQDTIDGLKKFSNFIGRDAAGHTGSYGISCTTDFFYALNWHRASVYVIDLSSHPFAVDISETVRGREQSPHARQFMQFRKASDQARQFVGSRERDERDDLGDDLQFEINVANRIAPEQIIGCYRGIELVFHKNKRYDPEYGK